MASVIHIDTTHTVTPGEYVSFTMDDKAQPALYDLLTLANSLHPVAYQGWEQLDNYLAEMKQLVEERKE